MKQSKHNANRRDRKTQSPPPPARNMLKRPPRPLPKHAETHFISLSVSALFIKRWARSRAELQEHTTKVAQAPSSGSAFSIPNSPSRPPSGVGVTTGSSSAVVQIGLDELLRSREKDRVALRAKAEDIERQWEAERAIAVKAGKEGMAQQVSHGRFSRAM